MKLLLMWDLEVIKQIKKIKNYINQIRVVVFFQELKKLVIFSQEL